MPPEPLAAPWSGDDPLVDVGAFFEFSLDLLVIRDLEGRVLKASSSWRTLLGHDPEELRGQPLLGLVHPDDMPGTLESVEEVENRRPGAPVLGFTNRYRHKDGRYLTLEWRAQRFGDRIYGVARDVTERVAAERELREAKVAAEAASRAKSDFLANMSHELRTPLNAVIGFADILRMRGSEPLTGRQSEAVEQIHTAGRHLLALIEEVLDFAKIESGKVSVSIEAVDPQEVAEALAGTFRPMADRAGISVTIAAPEAELAVRADHLRLKQVLANLISNAIKYNRPRGSVEVAAQAQGERVLISVRDTGLGIPTGRMADLFEPFERLGREGSGVEGAGLGLALTRRLVEAMGGKLHVESLEGVGSTFIVDLPAAEPAQVAAREEDRRSAVVGKAPDAVVLYIEDNASNIRLMRHIAEALGSLDLHVAELPMEGLELAAALRPDVILLDINLPGMDGFQVKTRLEADPATRDIPVIAISANVLSETVTRGKTSGFHGYLTKPINIEALVAAISAAVEPTPPTAISA